MDTTIGARGDQAGSDRVAGGLVYRRINPRDRTPTPKTVSRVEVYPQDVRIYRNVIHTRSKKGGGKRGRIIGFSKASRRRLGFTARNVEGLRVMLTLTYPAEYPVDGEVVKRHWSAFREWLIRRGIAGLWFLEFQQRGAPHLHVFLTSPVYKRAVSDAWYRIVASGDERHHRVGTRIEWLRSKDSAARYASKYAYKVEQKDVPEGFENVGRFWGLFGWLKCVPIRGVAGDRGGGSRGTHTGDTTGG